MPPILENGKAAAVVAGRNRRREDGRFRRGPSGTALIGYVSSISNLQDLHSPLVVLDPSFHMATVGLHGRPQVVAATQEVQAPGVPWLLGLQGFQESDRSVDVD